MNGNQIDFGGSNLFRNCLRAAFPMIIAQLLNLLYNIVDRIYIGRIPGSGSMALGGVGLCFPIITIITGFANLYGFGGAPLCSMERGKGDKAAAGRILNTSFWLLILTALLITAAVYFFCEPLLTLFGASAHNIGYALSYMKIYILGTIFVMTALGMNPFINAQGFARTGMTTIFAGALLNIILDPLFIFVFHMGVTGAAIATIISQAVSCIYVLCFLTGKTPELKLDVKKGIYIDISVAFNIVSLGISSFVMQCTNSIVSIVCNKLLAGYGGGIYVSVMTIITSQRQILSTPSDAFCDGISPMLSYNYGAGSYKKTRKIILILTALAISYSAAAWLFIVCFPTQLLKIFSSDSSILQIGVSAMKFYFAAFVFQTFQTCGQTVFKSLNMKKQAIFFSIFRKIIIVVPLTFLLPQMGFGADGVFMAEPISNVIGGLACYLTMLFMVIPELRRMEEQ